MVSKSDDSFVAKLCDGASSAMQPYDERNLPRVVTYQLPVPCGDCSVHLLINWKGKTMSAFIMDGGRDAQELEASHVVHAGLFCCKSGLYRLEKCGIRTTYMIGAEAIGCNFFGQEMSNGPVGFWCVGGDGYSYGNGFKMPPEPQNKGDLLKNLKLVSEKKNIPTPNEKSLMAVIMWRGSGKSEQALDRGRVPKGSRQGTRESPGSEGENRLKQFMKSIYREDQDEDEEDDPDFTYEDGLVDLLTTWADNNSTAYESVYDIVTGELKKATKGKYEMKDEGVEETPFRIEDETTEYKYDVVKTCVDMWNSISDQKILDGVVQSRYYLLQLISANQDELDGVISAYERPEIRETKSLFHL
ncbi:hypothetical protein F52700_1193 [Fusarium sp. NRRL 52700]|nr:hypothetical protein F52700_1193 [Fusarium sp. NRRL 52700]